MATMTALKDEIATEWVLAGAAVGPRPDATCYFRAFSGGHQAPHVTLGLPNYAQAHQRANALIVDDPDDPV